MKNAPTMSSRSRMRERNLLFLFSTADASLPPSEVIQPFCHSEERSDEESAFLVFDCGCFATLRRKSSNRSVIPRSVAPHRLVQGVATRNLLLREEDEKQIPLPRLRDRDDRWGDFHPYGWAEGPCSSRDDMLGVSDQPAKLRCVVVEDICHATKIARHAGCSSLCRAAQQCDLYP